jgi:hypothetical protein
MDERGTDFRRACLGRNHNWMLRHDRYVPSPRPLGLVAFGDQAERAG